MLREEKMTIDNLRETRVRQYANNYKGEITVFIHTEDEKGIQTRKIYEQLFKNYIYIKLVTQVNAYKIKIVFHESSKKKSDVTTGGTSKQSNLSDREKAIKEANDLAKSQIGSCHVYIPANYCEVQGVISWPIGQEISEFVISGKGKFSNELLNEVKILETLRLKKKSNEASNVNSLEDTSIVIVTFEGNLLPKKLRLDRMFIPVREYRRREMFCENCKKYSHTKKMCNNKKLDNPAFLCIACKSNDHLGGTNQCPKRKVLEKKHASTIKKLRERTYAEMLKELDPHGVSHEAPERLAVAPLSFLTRKEEAAQKQAQKAQQTPATQRPQSTSKQKSTQSSNKFPPGFQKNSDQTQEPDEFTNSIVDFLKSLMNDINVPPALQQIICTYATPYIDKFLKNFTNTLMDKILHLI